MRINNFKVIELTFLIVTAILFTYTIPAQENLDNLLKITFHPLDENYTTEVDLAKYFAKLNLKEIYYTYESTKNINITIDQEKGLAIISPKPGWLGTDIISFTAHEGKLISNKTELKPIKKYTERELFNLPFLRKVLFKEISIDPTIKETLGDILDLLERKTKTIAIPPIKTEITENQTKVKIGEQIDLSIEEPKKPKFSIILNTTTSLLYKEVANCSDNIQNHNEEGIDCGGSCKPCVVISKPSKILDIFTFLIILILIMVIIILFYLLWPTSKPKKLPRILSPEEKLGITFLQKINDLEKELNKLSFKQSLKEISKLTKEFFKYFYRINYEFTYFELIKELEKKEIKDKSIINLLENIEFKEYSPGILSKKEIINLINNLKDLIKNLTHAKLKRLPLPEPPQPEKMSLIDSLKGIKEKFNIEKLKRLIPKEETLIEPVKEMLKTIKEESRKEIEIKEIPETAPTRLPPLIIKEKEPREIITREIIKKPEIIKKEKHRKVIYTISYFNQIYEYCCKSLNENNLNEAIFSYNQLIEIYNKLPIRPQKKYLIHLKLKRIYDHLTALLIQIKFTDLSKICYDYLNKKDYKKAIQIYNQLLELYNSFQFNNQIKYSMYRDLLEIYDNIH